MEKRLPIDIDVATYWFVRSLDIALKPSGRFPLVSEADSGVRHFTITCKPINVEDGDVPQGRIDELVRLMQGHLGGVAGFGELPMPKEVDRASKWKAPSGVCARGVSQYDAEREQVIWRFDVLAKVT